MPIGYTIDDTRRLVFIRAWGNLTDDHVRAQAQGLQTDPRFDPTYSGLADLRDVTVVELTAQFIRSYQSRFAASARRAIVARSGVAFGMARMHQLTVAEQGASVTVVEDLEAALDWLGLDHVTKWPESLDAAFGGS